MIISTVGLKEVIEDDPSDDQSLPKEIYNNLFGNITYEKVLSYNVVPNPYYERYVFAKSSLPYDGIPIQGLNGKLYAEEPYSRQKIIDRYKKLIKKHRAAAPADPKLKTHLSNLVIILSKYKASPNLIKFIKRFQRTFVDKTPSTASGKFYSEFIKNMTDINRIVLRQEQIEKRVSVNSTCLDIRPPRHFGSRYIQPNPNHSLNSTGDLVQKFSMDQNQNFIRSDYIPQRWSKVFRDKVFINDHSTYGVSEFEEYRTELIKRTVEAYKDTPGVTLEMMNDAIDASMAEEFEPEASAIENNDVIVRNHGYFFFDWEKALYTQSAIANIVDLPRFCVFFGLSIPYTSFPIQKVELHRKELDLAWSPSSDTDSVEGGYNEVNVKMATTLVPNRDYPVTLKTQHSVPDGKHKYGHPTARYWTNLDATKTGYSHVKPVFFGVTDTENTRQGFLTNNNLHDLGMVSVSAQAYTSEGAGGSMIPLHGVGGQYQEFAHQAPRKNYRIVAFEFEDFMDDDVATLNTDVGLPMSGFFAQAERQKYITRNFNPWNEIGTSYKIKLQVTDTTMAFFHLVYVRFIQPLHEAWKEYLVFAEELCSYSEADEAFNQFFIDAMIEKYDTGSTSTKDDEIDKFLRADYEQSFEDFGSAFESTDFSFESFATSFPPWVSAAFLSAIIKEVFFNDSNRSQLFQIKADIIAAFDAFDPSDGADPPDPAVVGFVQEMYSISPQKGNIEHLRSFDQKLDNLIALFELDNNKIQDRLKDIYGEPPDTDPQYLKMAVLHSAASHVFLSSMKIDTPVSTGNNVDKMYAGSSLEKLDGISAPEIIPISPAPKSSTMLSTHPPTGRAYNALTLGAKMFIASYGTPPMSLTKIYDWIQTFPDYSGWQNRVLWTYASDPFPLPEGVSAAPPSMPAPDHRFRIYLPVEMNNQRIVDFYPNKRAFFEVVEFNGPGQPGYPRPKYVRLHWYADVEGSGDFSEESVSESSGYT